jgi:hemoglobin-like flavoprotein
VGFVNLATGEEQNISAPELITIAPEVPHRLRFEGPLRCRIDSFRQLDGDSTMPTPGTVVRDEVRQSFERCEAAGDFAQKFYDIFLNSSTEIGPYFAQTDFEKQRWLLRATVYMMVARDVSDIHMREAVDRIGESHSRAKLAVLPRLYELWLDSICEVVRSMDPEWADELEDHWRLHLRPGMQIIMSAY